MVQGNQIKPNTSAATTSAVAIKLTAAIQVSSISKKEYLKGGLSLTYVNRGAPRSGIYFAKFRLPRLAFAGADYKLLDQWVNRRSTKRVGARLNEIEVGRALY